MDKTISIMKNLKKGNFVLIDDIPCRVEKVQVTQSGKHGGAKCRVDALGLFDGRRKSIVKPADTKIDVPVILRKRAQVLAITGNTVQLMDMEDYSTFELDIPEELQGKLNAGEETLYYEVVGTRTLKQIR